MATKFVITSVDLKAGVTASDLRSVAASTLLTAEFLLDPNSLTRFFYDAFQVTESASISLTKVSTDTFAVEDGTATIGFGKNPADTFSFADTFSRTVQYSRALTDAATMVDVPSFSYTKASSDSFTVTDQEAITFTKPLADTQAITEVFSRTVTYSRAFSDAFSMDDAATIDAFSREDQLAKSNVISFTESQTFGVDKVLADSVTMSEDFNVLILPRAVVNAAPLNFSTLN
jgi:hypothetical protein